MEKEYLEKPKKDNLENAIDEDLEKPKKDNLEKTIDEDLEKPKNENLEKTTDEDLEKPKNENLKKAKIGDLEKPKDENLEKTKIGDLEKPNQEKLKIEDFIFENCYKETFYDQQHFFKEDDIKNIIEKEIPNIIKSDDFQKSIINYNEFIKFLGRKRNLDNFDSSKYFKSNNNSLKYSIRILKESKNYYKLEIKDANHNISKKKIIYKYPFICAPLKNYSNLKVKFITLKREIEEMINFKNSKIFHLKEDNIEVIKDLKNLDSYINSEEEKYLQLEEDNEKKFIISKNNYYIITFGNFGKKIDEKNLKEEYVFNTFDYEKEEIDPINLSYKFFNYFPIDEDLQINFKYYNTEERKEFNSYIDKFDDGFIKILYLSGPKGIGKSASLLYRASKSSDNIFYLNLIVFHNNDVEDIINTLLFECCRFSKCYFDFGVKEINDLKDYIRNYNNNISNDEFIINILKKLKQIPKDYIEEIVVILDNFIVDNNSKSLIEKINNIIESSYIRIIISISMSNNVIKEFIDKIKKIDINDFDFHFFPRLINNKVLEEKLLKNESHKFIENLNELGNTIQNYYLLKNQNFSINNFDFDDYVEKDINNFYPEDIIIFKIFQLLEFIKSKVFLSSSNLLEFLSLFPFKYVYLKKIKANRNILSNIDKKLPKNKLLFKYFENQNISKDDNFLTNYFHIEEIQLDFSQIYDNVVDAEEKYISEDLIIKLLGDYQLRNQYEPKNDNLYLYQVDFIFPKMEYILVSIIQKYLVKNSLNLRSFFPKGNFGGFFELLVNYNIYKSKKIANISFEESYSIKTLVPYNYSISFLNDIENIKKFPKYENLFPAIENKIKIKYSNILIKQLIFQGKYYDLAILIPNFDLKAFKLIVFQITMKKNSKNRLFKFQHELILAIVKLHLENYFDIKISETHFFYILSSEKNIIDDKETVNFCNNNNLEYLNFSIKSDEFLTELDINKGLISDKFCIHNKKTLFLKSFFNKLYCNSILYLVSNSEFESLENGEIYNFIIGILEEKFSNEIISQNLIYKISEIKYNKLMDISDLHMHTSEFCFLYIEHKIRNNVDEKMLAFKGKVIKNDSVNYNNIKYSKNYFIYLLCSFYPLKLKDKYFN